MDPAPSRRLLRFGIFEADPAAGELRKNGMRVRLPDQAFQVLQLLIENPGQVVTREELARKLWAADTFVEFDRGLNNAISRVRDLLDDSPTSPRFVETIPKRGYRFIAPVETIEPAGRLVSGPTTQPQIQAPAVDPTAADGAHALPVNAPARRARPQWIFLAVPVALGAVAVSIGLSYPRATSPRPSISSLAVLPLAYIGPTSQQGEDYLADGMTGALITELSKLGALRVISETSSRRYRNTTQALPAIARELGVDGIVEGNVSREGPVVRVTVQLIHAETDSHLWAETYTRNLGTALSLQSEVALAIAGEIGTKVTPDEHTRLTSTRPVDPEAHRHYVLGHRLRQRDTEPELLRALDHFEDAVRIEPQYARAYWGMAETWLTLSSWPAYLPPREGMPKARAAAEKALEIDGSLAEALAALAFVTEVFDWDLPAAEQLYKRALSLNPNDPIAHQRYSLFLTRTRRRPEGLVHAERASQLDPLSIDNLVNFGMRLFASGRRDEGIEMLLRAVNLDTTYFHPLVHLGEAYIRMQRGDEAIATAKRALELQGGGFHSAHQLAHIYGQLGRFADAAAVLESYEQPGARRNAYDLGFFYMSIKQYDNALRWLQTACEDRAPAVAFLHLMLETAQFDPIRKDPRFATLVACATTGLKRAF